MTDSIPSSRRTAEQDDKETPDECASKTSGAGLIHAQYTVSRQLLFQGSSPNRGRFYSPDMLVAQKRFLVGVAARSHAQKWNGTSHLGRDDPCRLTLAVVE